MRKLLSFLILGFLTLPLAYTQAQSPEDTIILSTSSNTSALNPILSAEGDNISQFIWSRLFEVDPVSGIPVPGLTSWAISEDGLTYTFTIREGAVWSDGEPITASDVEFSYKAITSDLVESPHTSSMALIESFEVVDERTFQVVFSQVDCTGWQSLAFLVPIPSYRYAANLSNVMTSDFNYNPDIASGPYILHESRPDDFTRLRANPLYWQGEPHTPYLMFRVVADPGIVNQALMTGDIDGASMSPDQLQQLATLENLNIFSFPSNNVTFMALNWSDPNKPTPAWDNSGNPEEQAPHPLFSDVRVRQAIAMGYDKDAILSTLGDGSGMRLISSVFPTISWAYNTELTPWHYDPERARGLLAEAGWEDRNGDGILDRDGQPFAFEIVWSPVTNLWGNIAMVAQDQLSQLGMNVTMTSLEWGAFINDRLLSQQYDALIVGFGGGLVPADPDSITYPLMHSSNDIPGSGLNIASYVNPEVDALLDEGRSLPGCSVEDRAQVYWEIQRLIHEDVAYDFAITTNLVFLMNKRIANFNPSPWNWAWNAHEWEILNE